MEVQQIYDAYLLSDGSVVRGRLNAIKRQKILNFHDSLLKFCEREDFAINKEILYMIISDNMSEIKEIFSILD